MHHLRRQCRLANATLAQHAYHPTALPDHPLREQVQFPLAPIEARHIRRVTPIDAWPAPGRRSESVGSDTGLLSGLGCRGSLYVGQQPTKPCFIEEHLLASRLPERTNLLCLTPQRPGLALNGEDYELFEVVGLGIGEASLPIDHGTAGDAKHISQFGLRQLEPGAQGQHYLPKGVVSLAVRGSLHGRSLSVSFSQTLRCEGMCSAKVTRCPVTSSTLLSILQNRAILAQWRRMVASSLSAPNRTIRLRRGEVNG